MFDWPEHIHTSPTRTSVTSRVVVPVTLIVCGAALAGAAGSFTDHFPSVPAFVVCVVPAKVTVIPVPGVSQP